MVNMKTEQALDVMMAILPDVAAIMNDGDADGILDRVRKQDKMLEAGDAMQGLVPLFAQKYRAEMLRIVAAFQGCDVETVRQQDIARTVTTLSNGLRVYSGFFACCLHMARNM